MRKIIYVLVLLFVLIGCSKTKSVNSIAKEIADEHDWFDYSYEVVNNYDENNAERYHITYYYSTLDGKSGRLEYIVVINNDTYVKEVLKWQKN